MAHLTNGHTTSKINRIQDEEKELLFQLRELYASDYRKYREHIRREPNIPLSIKKIYKLLDERKAYRRISDYFHRTRRSTKAHRSRPHDHRKSYRSSSRRLSSEPESVSAMQIIDDMDDNDDDDDDDDNADDIDENPHQLSDSSMILNDSDETIETNPMREDDRQRLQPSSSISPNPKHQQQQPSASPKPNLLVVRASIQKALRELDRAIICKSDSIADDYDNRPQRSSPSKINLLVTGQSNLDDMVRSLSSVVSQQQENTRSLIEESLTLPLDESNRSEKQSVRQVIDRLNGLVDRGHSIYDRIERILSEF